MNQDGVERRPTRAAAVPVGLAVLVGLLAASTGEAWLAAATAAPLALGVASVLGAVPAATRLRRARAALTGPARTRVGERVTHRLHLAWPEGGRDAVVVHVVQPGTAPAALVLEPVGSDGCHEVDVVREALHRGADRTAEVRLVCTDVLGLFRWSRAVPVDLPLVVHPRRARPLALPPGARGTDAVGRPRPSRTGDLAGVRGWQRGDGARDVHWRATARTGTPVVAVREHPQGGGGAVVLVGPVTAADEDRVALCAATGVALRGEDPGTPVVVLTRAGVATSVPPGPATAQLDWWARADLTGATMATGATRATGATHPGPAEVLAAAGGSGVVLVVGTGALDEAWWTELRALGLRTGTTVVRAP